MLLIGVAAVFLFLLFPNILSGQMGVVLSAAEDFIISQEGFIPVSRWDYQQYTWGYGTKAPGGGLSITESKARAELETYIQGDYSYLNALLTEPLNANQWAALLSFSYNLGRGNADNLVPNINAKDWDALRAQWSQYVNAGGVYNAGLAQRRSDELNLFFS